MGLCILAITPLVSLKMLDIGKLLIKISQCLYASPAKRFPQSHIEQNHPGIHATGIHHAERRSLIRPSFNQLKS